MAETFFDKIYKNKTAHTPDVLSCLANLSNDEVFTPPDVVNQMFALGGQTLEDAYTVLGVSPDASDDDVRKAYKKMVLQHHTDRVSHLGEEVKNAATKKMQEINKAKDAIFTARGMK